MLALNAIRCPQREDLVLHGPNIRDFDLEISASSRDRVVDGILRKLRQRTSRTCENCGRSGIFRADIVKVQVLCATCAAPWLMKARIREFSELIETSVNSDLDAVLTLDQVPIQLRPLLPASLWQMIVGGRNSEPIACASDRNIFRYRARFQAMERLLDEHIDRVTDHSA